ncbi:bis(5'-nucleosyl)-tetraphosphatase (symmetrical) YqeK [Natranaerofaba carboxydovora]|uniref:bis(5'-nucleosyl)-tetraphosphatase (symmetrical) YqeK n=1 Tax=Natranaerofaba carboxydovora TaxID=2742683 RepID=UPI001F14393A|nr:bis(5'-nucleosyl)-tetraphosphatase (symmetrical) YqeK [Natranaerofaba carboxydovora]UMZ72886.1 HD domain protein [Natranaerofaba carboxydovora]
MKVNIEFYEYKLKDLITKKRYEHSLRVVDTALRLAKGLDIDEERLTLAALIHDRGKELADDELVKISINNNRKLEIAEKINPVLLHGPVGAILIKSEWGISDNEILRAVEYHTTACPNMSMLEKVVFLADCLEPERDYNEVRELRDVAQKDIERAFKLTLDYTIWYVIRKGLALHPVTVEARNYVMYYNSAGGT